VQPPDLCPDGHGVMRPANRAERRRREFRPYRKERPAWTAADRTTPLSYSSPRHG
jgi:hypothetical protein